MGGGETEGWGWRGGGERWKGAGTLGAIQLPMGGDGAAGGAEGSGGGGCLKGSVCVCVEGRPSPRGWGVGREGPMPQG